MKKPYLAPFVKGVINLLCLISPYRIVARLAWEHHELIPFWLAEAYVVIRLLTVSLCYILLDGPTGVGFGVLSIICILMLIDLLAGTAHIVLIEREERRDEKGDFILVRDVSRWIILVLLNVAEIVLYFGVLYFRIGDEFCKRITDRLTAIYQSLLTFATLGYGEIHPVTPLAKILVMFQLVYFIIFVVLVVPRVFSAVRVKQHTNQTLGKPKEGQHRDEELRETGEGK